MRKMLPLHARALALGGALILGSGTVLAQGGPASAPAAPSGPDLSIGFQKQGTISPSDMVSQGQDYLQKMNDMLGQMSKLQELARQQKDVIKLNCVDDKLVQLKQLLGIGQQALVSLHAAISRGDDADRYHQYSRITIVYQQAQVLETESENCVGEDLTYVGSTQVQVQEPTLPNNDMEPEPPPPVIERPPVASPF